MFSKRSSSSLTSAATGTGGGNNSGGGASTSSTKLNHAGINNLGNSCYLNSMIQGLAASRPLRDALAEYPGAERALKASEARQAEATAGDRCEEQEQDIGTLGMHAIPPPLGTPTSETSPSLQLLLNENPFPENLPL